MSISSLMSFRGPSVETTLQIRVCSYYCRHARTSWSLNDHEGLMVRGSENGSVAVKPVERGRVMVVRDALTVRARLNLTVIWFEKVVRDCLTGSSSLKHVSTTLRTLADQVGGARLTITARVYSHGRRDGRCFVLLSRGCHVE